MEGTGNREEMVEMEEGRAAGPRWAEVQQEQSIRNTRADAIAIWCRRVAGLLVWGFVGIIISQLWQVAWQLKDVKLLALCMLITSSLLYIFYKRYRHIRDIGLTGVDMVRALAIDEGEHAALRGVSSRARALCVDFKFDPQAAFQERALGCGFEPYPPARRRPASSESTPLAPPGEEGEAEDGKGSGRGRRRRGRFSWLWRWNRRGHDTLPSEARAVNGARTGEEASTIAMGEGHPSIPGDPPRAGSGPEPDQSLRARVGHQTPSEGTSATAAAAAAVAGASSAPGAGGGQVIRACELNPSCSICLFEYYLGEDVTLLPCGHLYHTECIDIWMRDHVDCPYCRADINVWGGVGATGSGAGAGECPNRTSAAAAASAAAASATATAATAAAAAAAVNPTNPNSTAPTPLPGALGADGSAGGA